jgi:hypothetical protein
MSTTASIRATPEPSLELAERLVSELQNALPLKVEAVSLGVPSMLPFKVISLRESLLCRIADLAGSTIYLCKEDRGMGAAILARAVLEATALLFVLGKMVKKALESKEIGEFDRRIMAMLFGGKSDKSPVPSINILTHVEKMDRAFKGILVHYGNLSEMAHPNFAGVLGSYAQVETQNYELRVGPHGRLKAMIDEVVVPTLCLCLFIAGNVSSNISRALEEFSSICHKAHSAGIEEEGA